MTTCIVVQDQIRSNLNLSSIVNNAWHSENFKLGFYSCTLADKEEEEDVCAIMSCGQAAHLLGQEIQTPALMMLFLTVKLRKQINVTICKC